MKSQFKQTNIAELKPASTKVIDCILQQLLQRRGNQANYNEIKTHHNNPNGSPLIDAVLPFINDRNKVLDNVPQGNNSTVSVTNVQNSPQITGLKTTADSNSSQKTEPLKVDQPLSNSSPSDNITADIVSTVKTKMTEYLEQRHIKNSTQSEETKKSIVRQLADLYAEHVNIESVISKKYPENHGDLNKLAEHLKSNFGEFTQNAINAVNDNFIKGNILSGILKFKSHQPMIYQPSADNLPDEKLQEKLQLFKDPGSKDNEIQKKYEKAYREHLGEKQVLFNAANCVRICALEILNYLTDYKYIADIFKLYSLEFINADVQYFTWILFVYNFKKRLKIGSEEILVSNRHGNLLENKAVCTKLDELMSAPDFSLLIYSTKDHERLAILGKGKAYLFDANHNFSDTHRPYNWIEYNNWRNMTSTENIAEITKLTLKADHQHIPFTDNDIVKSIRPIIGAFPLDAQNDFNQRFPQETNAPIPQQQYQPNHLTQQHGYEVYPPQHVQNNWGNQVNGTNPFNNQYPQQNYTWPQNHPLNNYSVINQPHYQGHQFYQHQKPYIPAAGYH